MVVSMADRSARRKLVVLLVDDSPDNRAMYAEYLSFAGFHVLEADDGAQAVASARENRPDAVVIDVMLPVMDGCDATRALRADESTKHVRVLALSGRSDAGFRARVLDAGVDRFVEKPCLPHELVAHLDALLPSSE